MYQPVDYSPQTFTADTAFPKDAFGYKVYVFSKGKVFQTGDYLSRGDSITVSLKALTEKQSKAFTSKNNNEKSNHIIIHLKDSVVITDTQQATIHTADISKVTRYEYIRGSGEHKRQQDEKSKFFIFILTGSIVALFLVAFTAIWYAFTGVSGCFIATMVYRDYNAEEVKTLRWFRDEVLSRSVAGRIFIVWYYSWSPAFVKLTAQQIWLHKLLRKILDKIVLAVERKRALMTEGSFAK
ncbi:MAG: hypothetical protein Fur0041_08950 [Bacteroidia bacterium]